MQNLFYSVFSKIRNFCELTMLIKIKFVCTYLHVCMHTKKEYSDNQRVTKYNTEVHCKP